MEKRKTPDNILIIAQPSNDLIGNKKGNSEKNCRKYSSVPFTSLSSKQVLQHLGNIFNYKNLI